MKVIFHPTYGMNIDVQLSTNARNVSPQFGPKFALDGFVSGFGTEHDVDYVLCIGMGHVPHLRCSASYIPPTQRLRAGLKYAAPPALEEGRAGTARRKGGGHSIPAAARNLRCPAPATWWSSWGTAVPALYAERREGTACRAPTQMGVKGGACRRRDLSRREGVRRVRRASGAPGGRECAENPGPDGRPCACCIRYSRKPGCGRNCGRSAREGRRGRGTAHERGCGGGSKSRRRVRDREWFCGAPRFSGNPWLRGSRQEALQRPPQPPWPMSRHFCPGGARGSSRAGASPRDGRSCCVRARAKPPAHRAGAPPGASLRWRDPECGPGTEPQTA